MVTPGDYVILNDVIGCVQSTSPLRLLCSDGSVREFHGTPQVIMTAQQCALVFAEKVVQRL